MRFVMVPVKEELNGMPSQYLHMWLFRIWFALYALQPSLFHWLFSWLFGWLACSFDWFGLVWLFVLPASDLATGSVRLT
jgi:hypothetical protein